MASGALAVTLLAGTPAAAAVEGVPSGQDCAELIRAAPPADSTAATTASEKAAELDPSVPPPPDLLREEKQRGLVGLGERVTERAIALGKAAAAVIGVLAGIWALAMFLARGVLWRSRTLRNLFRRSPMVTVEPFKEEDEQKQLPSLLQAVLDNLGNDVGGQNIQFVSPQGGESKDVSLADAPSEVKYLSWVVGVLRPLAPKDRITVRLSPQPEGRQGLGIGATLVSTRGSTVGALTLWEAEIGLDDLSSDGPPLSHQERYRLLAGPIASWVYFTLADLQQTDVHVFGARRWRSYGLFYLGSRLYKTHRQRAQYLLRGAIDDDPGNIAAHLNVLFAEFDYRRTEAGLRYFEKLKEEVEALPHSTLAPRRRRGPARFMQGRRLEPQPYWFDAIWYRTVYGLAAVCAHIVCAASRESEPGRGLTKKHRAIRADGERCAMTLIGACWVALKHLDGIEGRRRLPSRRRSARKRTRFRQELELAALLNQMLPSAVFLLANLRLLDPSVVVNVLSVGKKGRTVGPEAAARWNKRHEVFDRLSPFKARPACPNVQDLVRAVDPVDFLPARARYNAACVHSEVARYQRPPFNPDRRTNRGKAMEELEKGLTPASAQWAREDPALCEVRAHPETRPAFARLLAEALPARGEWRIVQQLTFLTVDDAARLWLVGIEDVDDLLTKAQEEQITTFRRENQKEEHDSRCGPKGRAKEKWIDRDDLDAWVGRAQLRRHLGPLVDGESLDRVENALSRLGIGTVEKLKDQQPGVLSRRLQAVADPEWKLGHRLAPEAVAMWCR